MRRTFAPGAAPLLLSLAALVAAPNLAMAQEPANPAGGSAPATTTAPSVISEQAKQHFNAGVALLQDPEGEKVEEAYRQFKTAYEISNSPKILGNMGFCAMRLERDGEAIDAYSRYIREVPDIDPEERAQIVRDLQTLTVGVTRLSIEVNVPNAMILDERVPVRGAHVTNAYGPLTTGKITIGVRPGHHIITAKLAGKDDAVWEVEAYAGAKDQHSFVLKDHVVASGGGPGGGPSYTGPIIVLAAGGVILGASALTGVIALNKTNDIADKCTNDICPRNFDLDKERSSARTFVSITDVLLIIGGVTVLGGLYWLYRTSSSASPSTTPAPAKAQARSLPSSSFLGDWRLSL